MKENLVTSDLLGCARWYVGIPKWNHSLVLGHIQRGGPPSPYDRVLGTRFGTKATEVIAHGEFGKRVCLRGESVQAVDISEAVGRLKRVDRHGELVSTACAMGICFGN